MPLSDLTWIFVPGDRPERFSKAMTSGADQVILDLEDAVAPDHKELARRRVRECLDTGARCWVRLNAEATPWHQDDLHVVARSHALGVMVAKAEFPEQLSRIATHLPDGAALLPLVESALGIENAFALAGHPRVHRLAFGSIDFALDVDVEQDSATLQYARSRLVTTSRAADIPAPLDGVTLSLDEESTTTDAASARSLGMGGKLCIHPRQVPAIRAAFTPSEREIRDAERIVAAAAASGHGALVVDGRLVDKPVLARAEQTLARATIS